MGFSSWLKMSAFYVMVMSPTNGFTQIFEEYQEEAGLDHVYIQRFFNGGGAAFFDCRVPQSLAVSTLRPMWSPLSTTCHLAGLRSKPAS